MLPTCIVLVCGIPGSGKSTLIEYIIKTQEDIFNRMKFNRANQLCGQYMPAEVLACKYSNLNLNETKIFVISYDLLCDFPDKMNTIILTNEWGNYRKNILAAAEHYICYICGIQKDMQSISSEALALYDSMKNTQGSNKEGCKNHVFLIEDNFYYHSMRYEWFQIARKYGFGFCQIYLDCNVDIASQRNTDRELTIPNSTIMLMSTKFEIPNVSKNKWEKYSLLLKNNQDFQLEDAVNIMFLIEAAMNSPAKSLLDYVGLKKKAQVQCSINVVHQSDKLLRRLSGKLITSETKNKTKEEAKYISSKINYAKQQVLQDLKQGTLHLPHKISDAIKNENMETVFDELQIHLHSMLMKKLMNIGFVM